MQLVKEVSLGLNGGDEQVKVYVKQGDIDSRLLKVTLYEDGTPYTIPQDATARFVWTKPDGTRVLGDAELSGNTVSIRPTQQMLAVFGDAKCEVMLYCDGALLSSTVFTAAVYPAAYEAGEVESTSEYESFVNALLGTDGAIKRAEKAAAAAEAVTEQLPVKNLLFNPDFTVNQRGQTTYTRTGQSIYTVDRWMAYGCKSVTRKENTSPANTPYMLEIGLMDNSYNTLIQPMENFESRFSGKQVTIAFWLKANASGQMRCSFGFSASDDISYVKFFDVSTQWQKYTFTFENVEYNNFSTSGFYIQTATNTEVTLNSYCLAAPQAVFGPYAGLYTPSNPEEEFSRCARFYYIPKNTRFYGYTSAGNSSDKIVYPAFPFSGGFRATPEVTLGTVTVRGNGVNSTAQSVTGGVWWDNTQVFFGLVTDTAHGSYQSVSGWFDSSNPTVFDAELYQA